ncbi:hypothetical protein AVEN_120432-1, partial [Araneus ventricosus]
DHEDIAYSTTHSLYDHEDIAYSTTHSLYDHEDIAYSTTYSLYDYEDIVYSTKDSLYDHEDIAYSTTHSLYDYENIAYESCRWHKELVPVCPQHGKYYLERNRESSIHHRMCGEELCFIEIIAGNFPQISISEKQKRIESNYQKMKRITSNFEKQEYRE